MAARCGLRSVRVCAVLFFCLSQAVSATYYDTLNVESTATDSQIKKAFRQLAIKYHPDKNRSVDAEKTFREITEAYKVLSNKESRRLYDSLGHENFLKNEADPEDAHDSSFPFSFSDLFQDWDGGPFMEDTQFQWSFAQGYGEDEDAHGHFSFEGVQFHFSEWDENEEEYH